MLTPTEAVWMGAIVAFTLAAIVFDLRWRRIPNWLTVPVALLGLVFQTVTAGTSGLVSALAGFGTGFGILLIMWLIGGGGAGDVKLMGALGTWLGATLTFYALIGSAVFVAVGGTAILMASLLRGAPVQFSKNGEADAGLTPAQRRARRRLMPFALPLGLATWVIVAWRVLAPHSAGY